MNGLPPSECLEFGECGEACAGVVVPREALTASGRRFPRCEAHWERRLKSQAEIDRRYPERPPTDWSPLDAGEAWGPEDY